MPSFRANGSAVAEKNGNKQTNIEKYNIDPILYFSVFVCPLPFFSATPEPFVLKFCMVFRNGVGKTAKHFGAHWMNN